MTSQECKALRLQLGLTVAELAPLLGLTVKSLYNIECGFRQPGKALALLLRRVVDEKEKAMQNEFQARKNAQSQGNHMVCGICSTIYNAYRPCYGCAHLWHCGNCKHRLSIRSISLAIDDSGGDAQALSQCYCPGYNADTGMCGDSTPEEENEMAYWVLA